METIKIIWLIAVIIVILMFLIPIIYWLFNRTVFYSWDKMLEGGIKTPWYITILVRVDLILMLLAMITILIWCLNGII
jgi:hypothetical protein